MSDVEVILEQNNTIQALKADIAQRDLCIDEQAGAIRELLKEIDRLQQRLLHEKK